jgi:hypothetical protein
VCGASSGNQGLGLLPQFYRNFAGVQYQYRNFHSTHPEHETGALPEQSDDRYNTLQVWGRYAIGERIQLFAFVPYYSNSQTINGTKSGTTGLGDITVMAGYALIKKTDSAGRRHLLLVSAGIKALTGNYGGISTRDAAGLPNMQPGTGSWDIAANANYTYSFGNMGFNAEIACAITTPNKVDYKYGNRYNTTLAGFYRHETGDFILLPVAGVKYEYALHDYDNYSRKWLNDQTGGHMLFGSMGLHTYYKRIGLQLNLDLPLAQHYAGGDVNARYRTSAAMLFMF